MRRQIFRQIVLKRRRNTSVFQEALVRYDGKSASRLRTKPTGVPCAVLPYDFCTLLLNCLNCVLFVILCLLLTPLFYLFFHNTPFTVFLRAEVIFLPQFFLNCGIFFFFFYMLIKTGVMLLIQSLFAEGG